MVEVNVAEENVADIIGSEPSLPHLNRKIGKG
jgi:hypothetical protein